MKKQTIVLTIFSIAATLLVIQACSEGYGETTKLAEAAPISKDSMVKRGKYLVSIMGCNDCHSPMVMTPKGPDHDPERMLSGHPSQVPLPPIDRKELQSWVLFNHTATAMVGPWGVSYAANITSDATGIGNWTEKQFLKAIREGKSKGLDGGRMILPPMPWTVYANATDEDLKSIFAFLKTTKPVNNVVPAPVGPNEIK